MRLGMGGKIILLIAMVVAGLGNAAALAANSGGSVRGVVKGASGEPLSGAFVKLINEEKRLTFMFISQARGRYTAENLPPGKYTVQGIGNGFQSGLKSVEVVGGKTAVTDLSLGAPQVAALPNGWPGRPGKTGGVEIWVHEPQTPLAEGDGQQVVQSKCTQCHETERIVLLRFDRGKWESTVARMRGYIAAAGVKEVSDEEAKIVIDYLSKNYSGQAGTANERPDANRRLPRALLKGAATKYTAVDYELPDPDRDPHDLTVDPHGNAWVAERNGCCLAKFDPTTFAFSEVALPPAASKTVYLASAIAQGRGDTIWFIDSGPNRRWLNYDTKTNKFTEYPLPDSIKGNVTSNTMRTDAAGMIWATGTGSNRIFGLDPETTKFVSYQVPAGARLKKQVEPYGMAIAGNGAVYFAERDAEAIGKLDPATGKIDELPAPLPNSIPRRMGSDWDGNIWLGLHEAGKLVKIDQKTDKMTVYTPPTENAGVYAVTSDPKNHVIWFTEQTADRIVRFDPQTETYTEFPLARAESDARRLEVDPTNPNRIWWGGDTSNHLGYIELLSGNEK
jgi:virginiamycin B lyase